MDTVTSGDIQTIVAIVVGLALSLWALLLGMSLLFGRRAAYAHAYFEKAPWRTFIIGALVGLPLGAWSLHLLALPPPPLKIFGWTILSILLTFAAVGAGGLARLVGSRIEGVESGYSGFRALMIGCAVLVLSGLVPIFGWFVYAPVVILTSLGAGIQALLGPAETAPRWVRAPNTEPIQ